MIKLFYVKDNYIVPQESQIPVRWEDIHGDISGNTQMKEVINDLQNGINTNAQTIADEIQSRIDGDNTLQNQIDDSNAAIEQEITDRKNADKSLQDAIELEQTARKEADAMLQGNINTESILRSNADNYISGIVDSNKADIEGKLSDEADARRLADDALHNDLSAEAQARSEADTSLRNDLTEEIARAKAAETTNKNSIDAEATRATTKENELEDALEQEIADRKDADRTLQSNIDIEVARATEADNAHQEAISTETTNRITADNNLQEQISANETALHNLIKNDTAQDGRLDVLENTSTTVNGNIATINAKNAEQDLAIQSLQSSIDAEATRATNAETTLQTAISAETSNRETADSTLGNNITKEIADRKDADNVLQDNIDAEELARQTADSTLNDKITAVNTNISENYYKKAEVDSKLDKIVAGDISLQNYYTKAESDTKYQPKGNYALSGSSYTKSESDSKYALKGEAPTDIYTKEQVDNKLSNKADKSEIPTIPLFRTINGQAITGDTTNIVIEGGSGADMSNYYTKAESDNKYALKGDAPTNIYTKTEVDSKLSNKLDVTAYTAYDDTEIRQDIANKQDAGDYVSAATLGNYYTKAEALGEFYDKTLADATFLTKFDAVSTYYNKYHMDEVFLTKMDATDTYLSKFEASSNYQPKGDYVSTSTLNNYYTTGETESRLLKKQDSGDYVSASTLNNYYTKAETESRLFDKQNKLVSGENIKTINGQSIVGNGNITIEGGSGADLSDYYTKTESDNKYALKGDIPTDVYTKIQVDNKLSEKLDASAYTPTDLTDYAKTEDVNIELAKKLDASAYQPYDDTQVRQAISNKQDKGDYVSASTLNNYYTKTQVDNKLTDKLDITAYTKVIVDTELSSTSTNPVQNKAIALKLAELQAAIDKLKPSDDVLKVTFMSVNDKGIEVKPTYTVTYNNTTITTSNSEMYVAKDVTMTVVPSDIDGLMTPQGQTKKITEDTTFNFEYEGEALPVGTGRISFRTTSDNYTVNVANDSSKLTSMIIDNVSIPLESSGVTNYTFVNAGLHTGTYSLKDEEYHGYQGLFTNCDELEEVTVPEGVTALTSAFNGCTNLKTVSLPDTLLTIGNNEFRDCENLTGITIPDNVTSIGNNAFQKCSYLKNVDFGDNVTSIGNNAFEKCWQLRKVELKDRVKTIGEFAFNECPSITGITIGSACESIGGNAFCGTSSAQYVKMNGANAPTIGYNVFIYEINPSTSALADLYPIYTPNGAESSYKSSWGNYSDRIKSVADMPTYNEPTAEDITYIMTVDNSGNTMEFDAYFVGEVDSTMIYGFQNGGNSINKVKFSNKVTALLAGVLQNFPKITSVGGSGSGCDVEIPDTVTIIPANAFYYCQNITRVIIPDWVTGLGVKAFSNCVSLTNLTIGKNLTIVSNECFRYCSNIEGAIEFPTTEPIGIGNKAFANCNKVTSYTFNGPVTAYDNAFQQSGSTASLESITFNNGLVSAGQSILWGCKYCSTIILRNQEAAIQTSVASPSTIWGSTTASNTVGYKVSGDKFVYLNSDSTLTESDIDRSGNLFSANYSNFKLSKTL